MKNKFCVLTTNIIILAFMLIFFTNIAPLIIYNCDDWKYLGEMRLPIPLWGGWNPTRVFFETFMPVVGKIAGYILYPINSNFVASVTMISAILLSGLIVIMCIMLYQLLRIRFNRSVMHSLGMEVFFIAMFFLIFRTRSESNYMFCAEDLCCVYNYTMPGIINAIAVLWMARHKDFNKSFKSYNAVKKILFVLLIYFALLSNIFHSVITVAYCGAIVLFDLLAEIRSKTFDIRRYIKNNSVHLTILFSWLVVLLFEKSGGRAGDFETVVDIGRTFLQLKTIILALSIPFTVIVLISLVFFVWKVIYQRDLKLLQYVLIFAVSMLIVTVFLFMLNSIVGYMSRVDATWGIWFYLILIITLVMSDMLAFCKWRKFAFPLLLIIVIICCYYPDGKYMISSSRNRNYDLCYKASSYYETNIVQANASGENYLEIAVPEVTIGAGTNLTFYPGFGETVCKTLYLNGVVDEYFEPIEIVDPSLNKEFFEED